MEMYKMERLLQREDSDVSMASNGLNLKVRTANRVFYLAVDKMYSFNQIQCSSHSPASNTSDCRSTGREFDRGPFPYFRVD